MEKMMAFILSCASIALGIYFYKFAKTVMNVGKNDNIFGAGLFINFYLKKFFF